MKHDAHTCKRLDSNLIISICGISPRPYLLNSVRAYATHAWHGYMFLSHHDFSCFRTILQITCNEKA